MERQPERLEGGKMRGTEKQIAWAQDIKKKIIKTLEESRNFFVNCKEYDPTNQEHVAMAESFEKNIQALEKEDYAGDIIDMFDFVKSDDFMEAYAEFRTTLRLSGNPHTKNYIF